MEHLGYRWDLIYVPIYVPSDVCARVFHVFVPLMFFRSMIYRIIVGLQVSTTPLNQPKGFFSSGIRDCHLRFAE